MRYYLRRVGLQSMARLGCFLGWLIALLPALLSAGLVVLVLQRVHEALVQIKPFSVTFFGQELLRVDLLQLLQLQPLDRLLQPWAENPVSTFLSFTLLLMLIGGALWMATVLLVGLVYNLIARFGWGLVLELKETRRTPADGG